MRKAFTLIEILVVISVILILMGMMLGVSKRSGQSSAARALIATVAAAINSYGVKSFELWSAGSPNAVVTRSWDVDGDTILDGVVEPPLYWRQPPALANAATLDRLRYRGFIATIGMPSLRKIRESDQVVLDPWGRPLRITWAARIYGDEGFCVWSQGRDPDNPADDLLSREKR